MRSAGLAALSVAAIICAGCAQQQRSSAPARSEGAGGSAGVTTTAAAAGRDAGASTTPAAAQVPQAHPQAIEPVAGKVSPVAAGASAPAQVSVGSGSAPGAIAAPVSDAVVRQELAASGLSPGSSQATLTTTGLAIAPVDAPAPVQQVIAAGNQIAHLPYRFGGGHGTFEDNAYDCSGSLSFAFAAAGLLNTTVTSGQLMGWGKPGPGKWITVFAAPGHTFMYVAGLRFDTVALAQTGSRWSDRSANEPDLHSFAVRHPPGL